MVFKKYGPKVEIKTFESLPVLLVRNLVLFPYVYLPVAVSRDFSTSAIFKSMSNFDSKILVVLQKDPKQERPSDLNDVYSVGVLCKIIKMDAVSKIKNQYKVMIQGQERIKLLNLENNSEFYQT